GELAPGRLGSEKEQPVELLLGKGLELREERAQGLADAGGSLGHQGVAVPGGAIYLVGELALPGAKGRPGKLQLHKASVAGQAVGAFLLGPGEEAAALQLEEFAQTRGPEAFAVGRFLLGEYVEIDHCQVDPVELVLGAEQPAIDLHLRPVQQAVIVRDALDVAPVGLDLLQQIEHGVVAIGAAGDEQTLVAADQGDLAQVVGATSCYYCPVARYAL